MARVTVDDCLKRIPNRFQLTLAATYRARQITIGSARRSSHNTEYGVSLFGVTTAVSL